MINLTVNSEEHRVSIRILIEKMNLNINLTFGF